MKRVWLNYCVWMLFISVCICKSENESTTQLESGDASLSCSRGWFTFGDMCYRLLGRKRIGLLSWDKAAERCRKDHRGTLAVIHSQELQDFLIAFLQLSSRTQVWIGLHDKNNESQYEWEDGSTLDFEYWLPTEPNLLYSGHEDCVEMVLRSRNPEGKPGGWNDLDCNNQMLYICQKRKEKQAKKPYDPRLCAPELGGGWKFEKSCFNFVPEKKTWSEAEAHCEEHFKGHLVTITDFAVNLFLDYVFREQVESMWIGIKVKDDFQQKWSSGWFVAFENWHEKETIYGGSCAIRNPERKWNTRPCAQKLPFICEYSTATPPVLKPPDDQGAKCPDVPKEWRDLGGERCYYFNTKETISWHKANFNCMRRGSTLLSIHSEAENRILHNFVRYKQKMIYIGLIRRIIYDEELSWSDGSPMDFTFWDENEPNREAEQCGIIRTDGNYWHDQDCDLKMGYICAIPKISPNRTTMHPNVSCSFSTGVPLTTLLGVLFCVITLSGLLGIVIYYFRPCDNSRMRNLSSNNHLEAQPGFHKKQNREEIVLDDSPYENINMNF